MIAYLVRYGEIALKGKNRYEFENILVENIKRNLQFFGSSDFSVEKEGARIIIRSQSDNADKEIYALKRVFGVKNFSVAKIIDRKISSILSEIDFLIKSSDKDFRFVVRRSDKKYYMKSPEILKAIIEHVKEIGLVSHIRMDSENEIYVEIQEKNAYLCYETFRGPGGLPVGKEKVVLLLSGGIDSPVSALSVMKRGLSVLPLFLDTSANQDYIKKIKVIVEKLKEFDPRIKLRIMPYYKFHRFISDKIKNQKDSRFACVLCKRGMLYLASKLAKETGAKAIVTGDNLAQVASQTIENLITVSESARDVLIIRPLITLDKEEIIEMAKKYEIFNYINVSLPCPLLPKHPATKSHLDYIKDLENRIGTKEFLGNEILANERNK